MWCLIRAFLNDIGKDNCLYLIVSRYMTYTLFDTFVQDDMHLSLAFNFHGFTRRNSAPLYHLLYLFALLA